MIRIESIGSLINDGDAIGHLTFLKEYIKNKGKKIELNYLYTLEGPGYPTGFHKLFYYLKIPLNIVENYGCFVPIISDSLLLLVTAFSINLYGGNNFVWLLFFPFLRIFFGNQGRSQHFTERAYGVLWGNIYLLCTIGFVESFYVDNNWFLLLIANFAFLIFSVSSKFAWQGSFFISLILSLISLRPIYIFVYLASTFLSFIITKGYSLEVLKGLIRFSFFYKTYLGPRSVDVKEGHYSKLFKWKGIREFCILLFIASPLRVITDNPLNLIILFIFLPNSFDIWMKWSLVGVFLTLIISLKSFSFLGEPERYLEFSIIPVFITLSKSQFLDIPPIIITLTILSTLAVLSFHLKLCIQKKDRKKRLQESMLSLKNYFRRVNNSNIITIPFRLSFFLGYNNQNKNKFITLLSNIGLGELKEEYCWLMKDRYPFVRSELDEVAIKYDLDYFVVHKDSVNSMNKEFGNYYNIENFSIVYENPDYAVLKI